ncbi:MAG: CPXCG motif-containing cysteine-rich protein [Gammaproteobacteria bacterium]|nr:CPXCG motif-containing cysteine-rich protein [Gammaproteobacteria bacterium]
MIEHGFECPYCWESITMLLDLTEAHQEYVEDCEVCCNPIAVELTADQGALTQFEANQMD